MASRYWIVSHSMGYVGTDSHEEIDALDYLGLSEKELEQWSDDDVEQELCELEFETACEKISVWAKKKED